LGIVYLSVSRAAFCAVNEYCSYMRSARWLPITQDADLLASSTSCPTVDRVTSEHGGVQEAIRSSASASTAWDDAGYLVQGGRPRRR
jgi:hypothetical protein